MYTPAQFLQMVNDRPRLDAYLAAISAVVRPGDHVVELGAGFGFFSVAACRAGAAHVDAVDINPIVVALGPPFAAAHGCDDRITFHHADATRLALPRQADVLLGDLRGPLPLTSDHVVIMSDARDRLLRSGGRMIGARDTLCVAPTVAPTTFREGILEPEAAAVGFSLAPVQAHLRTVPYRTVLTPQELLGPGVAWGSIDYATTTTPRVAGSARCAVTRTGRLDGLALWFDAELAPGIGFSNAPGTAVSSYGQVLLPMAQDVDVREGDALDVSLEAVHTDRGYVWRWRGVRASDGALLFDQNSLAETVLSSSLFGSGPDAPLPERGEEAAMLGWLIGRLGSGESTRQAAAAALAAWPHRFSKARDAERWLQRTLQELDRTGRGVE